MLSLCNQLPRCREGALITTITTTRVTKVLSCFHSSIRCNLASCWSVWMRGKSSTLWYSVSRAKTRLQTDEFWNGAETIYSAITSIWINQTESLQTSPGPARPSSSWNHHRVRSEIYTIGLCGLCKNESKPCIEQLSWARLPSLWRTLNLWKQV